MGPSCSRNDVDAFLASWNAGRKARITAANAARRMSYAAVGATEGEGLRSIARSCARGERTRLTMSFDYLLRRNILLRRDAVKRQHHERYNEAAL